MQEILNFDLNTLNNHNASVEMNIVGEESQVDM